MSLITVGTVAIDNVKTPSGARRGLLGGSATHFSMGARLFADVHIAANVGRDFPQEHLSLLQKKGVDVTSVFVDEGKTFQWDGEYKAGQLNSAITLATEIGVLGTYTPRINDGQRDIPYVFLANGDPEVQARFLALLRKPKFVGLDTMNLWIAHKQTALRALVKKVDLFVVNDGEAAALTGETNVIAAAKKLHAMGPAFVVVKKGEHGVYFSGPKCQFAFPAYPIEKVVDPTGAGDTFAGALMGYVSKSGAKSEASWRKAVLFATVVASFNVEGFGLEKTAKLTMADVTSRMKKLVAFIKPA